MPSDTPPPSVPAGFKRVTLRDILSRRSEPGRQGLPTASVTMYHGLVARNTNERRVETTLLPSQHLLARKGDIVYNMMRMWQGACGVANEDCLISPAYVVLRPNDDVCSDYIFHLFKSAEMVTQFHKHSRGLTGDRLRLYYDEFQQIEAVIPIKYSEQAAIAEAIKLAEESIRNTEMVISKLRQSQSGLLRELLTRGLDEDGQMRDPFAHFEEFTDSPYGRIPKNWEIFNISDLFMMRSGGTPSRSQYKRYFQGGTIPWVKTMDLNEGVVIQTDEKITEAALRESSCELIPPHSILVAMYGGWEQIGRTGQLGLSAATNQAMVSLIPRRADVDPAYALLAIQHGRKHWRRVAASTRKDPNITKQDIAQFKIPVPTRDTEQAQIVELANCMQARVKTEEAYRDKLKLQKRGLMHDLLTGRVRV